MLARAKVTLFVDGEVIVEDVPVMFLPFIKWFARTTLGAALHVGVQK